MKTKLFFLTVTLFLCFLSHSQGIWITNTIGCKFFSPSDKGDPTFEWDGKCVDSFVNGTGTLKLYQKTLEDSQIQTKLTFTYDGAISNGKFNGQGKITYDNGTIFIGEFKDNLSSGQGAFTWSDGVKYQGEFQNGERNGLGIIELKNGEKFNVQYKNDRLVQDKTIVDKLQTNNFTANFIEWNCLKLKSNIKPIQALSKGIFDCYKDLNSKYDTPLKREAFTKSKEYAEVYNKYRANQLTYLNNSYYYYYFNLENWNISDYYMEEGFFVISLNNFQSNARSSEESFNKYYNLLYKPVNVFCIKSGEFYLSIPTIPLKREDYAVKGETFDDSSVSLSIKVDKSKALEIENNRDKIDIYLITLGPIKKGNIYNDNLKVWIKSDYKSKISEYYLVNKAQLVIANKETGEIYYSKLYAPVPPQKK